jgi:cytochrome c-type biogenesis protein
LITAIAQADLAHWWAPGLAFLAGIVSFASPCVFPLVPGYLAVVSGAVVSGSAAEPRSSGRASVTPMLLFIAGFAIVFTMLGAFAEVFVRHLRSPAGQAVAGGIVIFMGCLMIVFAFQWGRVGMYMERRPFLEKVRPGTWGALPLGMAFAAGWTPCIGPVLSAILTIGAGTGRAVLLLICYSAGLGVPFLLVGLGVQRFMGALAWVRRNYKWISACSGVLLIAVGYLIATNQLTRLLAPLTSKLPAL